MAPGFVVGAGLFVVVQPIAGPAAPGESAAASTPAPRHAYVYVGTYTRGETSQGIYGFRMDLTTAEMTPVGVTSGVDNPSFLAIHPNQRFLYAVGEVGEFRGQQGGAVIAFAIDAATGRLTQLNQQSSRGPGPCHLVVERSGRNVLVANYSGGSVAVLPIRDDGRLVEASCFIQHAGSSVNPRRQEGPHAHSVNIDAANRFALVADLGLDRVLIYRLDAERGQLRANDPAAVALEPGAGPRHFAFHPDGRHAYVINELQSTVTAFDYDAERGGSCPADHLDAAARFSRRQFDGRNPGASVGQVSLRLQSGARQHRDLLDRRDVGEVDSAGA